MGLVVGPSKLMVESRMKRKFHVRFGKGHRETCPSQGGKVRPVSTSLEKGLSGLGSTNVSDAGTTGRMFSILLTWMEEHTTPVFVAATSNITALDALPPEFIERFDEVFYVAPPGFEARKEIFAIHLRQRGRDPTRFDLEKLAEATEGLVGRQIRNLVWAALYRAFGQGKELTTEIILDTLQEKRRGVRDVKGIQARPASSPERERGGRGRAIRVERSNRSNQCEEGS